LIVTYSQQNVQTVKSVDYTRCLQCNMFFFVLQDKLVRIGWV